MQLLILGVTVCVALAAAPAQANVFEFYGPHPIETEFGSGMCVVDGPHIHAYEPKERAYYVQDGPYWTFVGDPTEFEPEAPRHAYYGHHPVWWGSGRDEHYCYITGAHHHWHAPIATVSFELKGGAYWYVGAHPGWYEGKKHKHKHVDAYYGRRGRITRPVVVVEPPRGWLGVHLSIGAPLAPIVVHERHRPAPVVIEHHHHYHDKHKHKHKHKHKGKHRHHDHDD